MKYFYLFLFCCSMVFNSEAQNSLLGTVTNKNNNEPLIANVYFPKLGIGTVADFNGAYTIANISEGTYSVVFSLLGYTTISKRISIPEDTSLPLDIEMVETAIEMEQVIISTPFHKLQSDNVMKVDRVAINELQAKGAITLTEGLSDIGGVSIVSTGIGIGKPVIRGLSSNRVLTYAQGVRLENQQFGEEHGLGINAAGIESVEVIKGPASLLYGSDALGGVLYINPEKFTETNKIAADFNSAYYSNTLGTALNLGAKVSGEKLKFLVRGATMTHSDYETGSGQRVTNTRFNEKDFKSGLRFQGQNIKSTLRYNYNRANIGIPEEIGTQTTSKDLASPFQEIDNHILSWENRLFLKKSSFDVKLGYLFNDRREFEESVTEPALQLKLSTFNYDVKYNLPDLGKFETIVGLQGMFQKNKNFGEELLIPNATTRDIGVMATTHYHLETIDLQAGLRFDHRNIDSEASGNASDINFIDAIDLIFNSFNAALGAKAEFSKALIGRLNIASGFRAPNLAELASNGVHEGTNRYEIGNAALNNEQNYQLDLSLEFRDEHFEISANGFYNGIQNYIFITPSAVIIDNAVVYNYVQENAYLYGGEVGLHIHPHPLDWLHIESSFETVSGKLDSGDYLPLIPANTIKNTLRVEFNQAQFLKESFAFIKLENTLEQNNAGAFETSTKGYNLLSLGGGSSITLRKMDLDLGISVTNLTNESYVAHLSRLKPDGIQNIGRNITFSMRLHI
jgi:iron complex outermembrane receptor protein